MSNLHRPPEAVPLVSLVLAAARNGTIGKDGGLPWHLPDDLRQFKALTVGGTVVMGRRTWDEMKTPLVDRTNVVLSRQRDLELPGAVVVHDLDAALAVAGEAAAADSARAEVFVIGGAEVFAEAVPRAQRVYLTWVDAEVPGDTAVPLFWQDEATWELLDCRVHERDTRHAHRFEIRFYERRP